MFSMCSRSFIVQKRGPKSVARYDLADSLGSGSFGAVLKATDRISNAPRAWKALKKGNSAQSCVLILAVACTGEVKLHKCFAQNYSILQYFSLSKYFTVQVKWMIFFDLQPEVRRMTQCSVRKQ